MKIQETSTIYEVTGAFPQTIPVLADAGFRRITDSDVLERFGVAVTVRSAAIAVGLEPSDLLLRLRGAAKHGARGSGASRPVTIAGLVPCPIRIPMTNVLESAVAQFSERTGSAVTCNLQAAYTGTEWLEEHISSEPTVDDLPDIFLSAGFRLFFTDRRFRSLRDSGAFADRTGWPRLNTLGTVNSLADPHKAFSVISVVPAVFMVNLDLLGDRPVPQSWAEILSPEYENSLALPIGDFDLFDSLLIGVERTFGTEGIERLARNMFQSMHPAQMISSARPASTNDVERPAITIMPYFFTRTITEDSPLIAVWPEDGALTAPVLLVTRADRPEIQPLIDVIAGESMSRVLTRLGLFPSTHPANDDFDAEAHPLQWPGWDLLLSDELPRTLERTTAAFSRLVADRTDAGGRMPHRGAKIS